METFAVLPVRNELHYTMAIMDQLLAEPTLDRVYVFDNGSTDSTPAYLATLEDERVQHYDAVGYGIYDMWDAGARFARADMLNTAVNLLILNNDLVMHPLTIPWLVAALRADDRTWITYPDYDCPPVLCGEFEHVETHGTYRHGGMSGFCFMLKLEKITWAPLVDPVFQWWAGDDDIAFTVERHGGAQIRVKNCGLQHVNEGTAHSYDLNSKKSADLDYCRSKWGR